MTFRIDPYTGKPPTFRPYIPDAGAGLRANCSCQVRVHHANDDDPALVAMTAHTLHAAVQQWSRDNAEGVTRHDVFGKMLRDGKPEPETEAGVALAAMNADPALEAMSAPSSLAVFKSLGLSTHGRR